MSAPPENANARLQPGARAIIQTNGAKLRTRVRHVNAPDDGKMIRIGQRDLDAFLESGTSTTACLP